MSRLPLMLTLLLLCPGLAAGQSGADLIPDDATAALAINSVADVRDKGEKFVKEHGLRVGENRPSGLFNKAFDYLRVRKGLDEKGAAAVVLPNLKKLEEEEISWLTLRLVYIVIPVKDVAEMLGNFDLKPDDLKDGKILWARGKYLLLKGKHLYVGFSKDGLSLVSAGKPLTAALRPQQKAALTKSDLALHFGAEALGPMYRKQLDDLEKNLRRMVDRDDEQSKSFVDALRQMRFVVGGLSLDEGGKINVIATFNEGKEGAAARKFLTALRAGPGSSDLIGLPAGQPWLAYAARGDGTSNVAMVRALLNLLYDQGKIDKILTGKERLAFVSSFERLYKELKGSRAALYTTSDAKKLGQFALVGILDVGDTDKHLAELPNVVKHLNRAVDLAMVGSKREVPEFSYESKDERLDGSIVHRIHVKVPDLRAEEKRDVEAAYGPDWSTLRLVVQGKKMVFLVGSDVGLLKQTMANLKKGSKGLAEEKVMTGELSRLAKERKLEFHVNVRNLTLYRRGAKAEPVTGLTSVALTVETDRVQLEIVAAKSEIKPFAALLGLAEE